MKPVTQTIFGEPYGNCTAACIASILDCNLISVPHFNPEPGENTDETYWPRLLTFLESHGLTILFISEEYYKQYPLKPKGYHIANGPAARGLPHSCVMLDGEIVWDPHPDRTGLKKITDIFLFVPIIKE